MLVAYTLGDARRSNTDYMLVAYSLGEARLNAEYYLHTHETHDDSQADTHTRMQGVLVQAHANDIRPQVRKRWANPSADQSNACQRYSIRSDTLIE